MDLPLGTMPVFYTHLDTPLGPLLIVQEGAHLTAIHFPEGETIRAPDPGWQYAPEACAAATAQLDAYFAGTRRTFDLPLAPKGTPFQRTVWEALCRIPYGATISYAGLAHRIGRPAAVRAVGAANGRNPLPIVVPCHRVVGSDGSLTGYAGGLSFKQALLDLESRHRPGHQMLLF